MPELGDTVPDPEAGPTAVRLVQPDTFPNGTRSRGIMAALPMPAGTQRASRLAVRRVRRRDTGTAARGEPLGHRRLDDADRARRILDRFGVYDGIYDDE